MCRRYWICANPSFHMRLLRQCIRRNWAPRNWLRQNTIFSTSHSLARKSCAFVPQISAAGAKSICTEQAFFYVFFVRSVIVMAQGGGPSARNYDKRSTICTTPEFAGTWRNLSATRFLVLTQSSSRNEVEMTLVSTANSLKLVWVSIRASI